MDLPRARRDDVASGDGSEGMGGRMQYALRVVALGEADGS
jgi:hypothetical protein